MHDRVGLDRHREVPLDDGPPQSLAPFGRQVLFRTGGGVRAHQVVAPEPAVLVLAQQVRVEQLFERVVDLLGLRFGHVGQHVGVETATGMQSGQAVEVPGGLGQAHDRRVEHTVE